MCRQRSSLLMANQGVVTPMHGRNTLIGQRPGSPKTLGVVTRSQKDFWCGHRVMKVFWCGHKVTERFLAWSQGHKSF